MMAKMEMDYNVNKLENIHVSQLLTQIQFIMLRDKILFVVQFSTT